MAKLHGFVTALKCEACAECEKITLGAPAVVKFVHPARVAVEVVMLTYFRRIGKDRAHSEGSTAKAVNPVGGWACVVIELLDPATDYAKATAELEALNSSRFQIGKDAILVVSSWIFGVERQPPIATQFNVRGGKNLRVSQARDEGPGIRAQDSQTVWVIVPSRRPKREA